MPSRLPIPRADILKCRRSRIMRELRFLRRLIRVADDYERQSPTFGNALPRQVLPVGEVRHA
jgi:hypothetical protein